MEKFTITPEPQKSFLYFSHDDFPIGRIKFWLPEAIKTERGGCVAYPSGMQWHQEGSVFCQEATVENAFGRGNVKEVEPGVLECVGIQFAKEKPLPWSSYIQFCENCVNFTLTIMNPHKDTIPRVAAALCCKFMDADWWSDGQTYFLSEYGIKSIAEVGRTAGLPNKFQAWMLLDEEEYANPFMQKFWGFNEARAMVPIWVSHCEREKVNVVIKAESAYYIQSNAGNPCTDIGLKFGDIAPGEAVTCRGCLEYTREPVEKLF